VVSAASQGPCSSEQELTDLGIVRQSPNAPAAKMTGARYIVLGTVSSYDSNVGEQQAQAAICGLLGSAPRKQQVEPRITWRSTSVSSTAPPVRWWDAAPWKGEPTSTA